MKKLMIVVLYATSLYTMEQNNSNDHVKSLDIGRPTLTSEEEWFKNYLALRKYKKDFLNNTHPPINSNVQNVKRTSSDPTKSVAIWPPLNN